MEEQVIIKIVIGFMLIFCGMKDIISRRISLPVLVGTFFVIIIMLMVNPSVSWVSIFGGLVIGLLLLVISKLSGEQIGMGDGFVFCVTGLGFGFWSNLCLLIYSLSMAAVFSGYILVVGKKNRKQTIPFIPFVCIGYIGVLLT